MRQSKRFEHMDVYIEVVLSDTSLKGFNYDAVAGVYDCPKVVSGKYVFTIWFKEYISTSRLCHECWHLFMTIMKYIDSQYHGFSELNSEIYAYTFHALCVKVEDTATGMKLYKEFWEKRQKEKSRQVRKENERQRKNI